MNSNGVPNTLWGIFYSIAQPTRFYHSQLDALDRRIASYRGLMDLIEDAEAGVKSKINQAEIDASREQILTKYPELRPSETQSRINALRREADKLEENEWRRRLRGSDDEDLQRLKTTRKLVEQKLEMIAK